MWLSRFSLSSVGGFNRSSRKAGGFLIGFRQLYPLVDHPEEFHPLPRGRFPILLELTRPAEVVELEHEALVFVDIRHRDDRVASAFFVG